MNTQKHLNPNEIKSLLFGDADGAVDEVSDEIALHVEGCQQCQSSMNKMAASPELWKKASELITDACLSETIAQHADEKRSAPNQTEALPWDYPVEKMLDQPSHPEMMGRVDVYDVECEIGRGGMGVVLKAHDSDLNRPIAIKILAPHLAANGTARKRFSREARAAAAILHPNVIAIHGVSSPDAGLDETPFIVMPYVAGPSLQRLVDQNGPVELKEMVRIALQIAAGLTAAHSQAVIHRDIKPANILIEKGVSRVVITDFGLAQAGNDASMTHTGWLAGTPNFMSPEQAHGKRLDGRSDLFSLGSVMYFMATGRMPFRADSPMAILNRICNETQTPVRQVNSDVSQTLAEIVEKLLQKNPDDRFQSAGALHETLEKYLAYLHQPDIKKPPVINQRRDSKWIGLTVVAIALAAIVSWAAFSNGWFANQSNPDSIQTNRRSEPSNGTEQPNKSAVLSENTETLAEFNVIVEEFGLIPESELESQQGELNSLITLLEEEVKQIKVPSDFPPFNK